MNITNTASKCLQRLLMVTLLTWAAAANCAAGVTNRISRFAIEWSFDQAYEYGAFINGDPWVVGPVRIVKILPGSTNVAGREMNGSMVNPVVGEAQGYDTATYAHYNPKAYKDSLNVGKAVSGDGGLLVQPGSSIISTVSHSKAGNRPQLTDASILTVLAVAPEPGSFRPAPYGPKWLGPMWSTNAIDYSALRQIRVAGAATELAKAKKYLERPWLEQNTIWTGRYLHPLNNQPEYGRDIAHRAATALLLVNTDLPLGDKMPLILGLIQLGIDIHGAALNGGVWVDNGGHGVGRKMPLLFAARLLQEPSMFLLADASKSMIFQEDRQTWIVTAKDVGRWQSLYNGQPRLPYREEDIGMPEWGIRHTTNPEADNRDWNALYRDVASPTFIGHSMCARVMGLEAQWNWPAFFSYSKRYMEVETKDPARGLRAIDPFVAKFWGSAFPEEARSLPPRNLRLK